MLRPALVLTAALLAAAPVAAQNRLMIGQTVSGELTSSDPRLSDQTHYDCYAVETTPGRRVQVDMSSDAFDSYLMVGGRACTALTDAEQDDDGGGGLSSRIVHMGTGQTLYILANSVGAGATGAYQLRAWSSAGNPSVTRLNVGQTANGTLTSSDMTLPDNSHYDCFSVQTRAGQTLQIDQTSSDFDSYLSVGAGSCEQLSALARDDDSGGGLNARIVHEGDGGVLFIQANSVSAGQTGAYQLRVSQAQSQATIVVPQNRPALPQVESQSPSNSGRTSRAVEGNRPPTASLQATPLNIGASANRTVTVATTAADPDGDELSYSYTYSGGRMSGEGPNGGVWNLSGVQPGTYEVSVFVQDGKGCWASPSISVRIED